MIEPQDVPLHLLYEWFPLSSQEIADVLNDEERRPYAEFTEDDQIPTYEAGTRA